MSTSTFLPNPIALAARAEDKKFTFYQYDPSIIAAIIFTVLFLLTTLYHNYQAVKKCTLYFIPLIIGGYFEWTGYITRILSAKHDTSTPLFITQTLLLLLPPSLFAASIYMILGRLILFTRGEGMAPIRANWLTKIFVAGDVLSFLVQAGGGSMMATASTQNLGKTLVIIGLVLQIAFFTLFIITSIIFHIRMVRSPTPSSLVAPWQKYLFALYVASILILIRSLFRIFEFAGGHDGRLMRSEVYLYVFDAVLMVGVMVVFNIVHPGDIIGRRGEMKGAMRMGGLESGSER